MRAIWEEINAVARAGWAVLGGAAVTLTGWIQGAAHHSIPSALWWIPLLLGVIVAEALVIAGRRRERDEARTQLATLSDSVKNCLALDAVNYRWGHQDGPPASERMEFRVYFHNTADVPITWEILDQWVEGQSGQSIGGLGKGVVAPGKTVWFSIAVHVVGAAPGEFVPPSSVNLGIKIAYGLDEPRFEWTFGVVVGELPAAESDEWTLDVPFLWVDNRTEERA